jgi:hypothetical protein
MAEGKALGKDDLFESDAFSDAIKGADELLKIIRETNKEIKGSLASQKQFVSTFKPKSFDDVKKVNTELKQTSDLIKMKQQLEVAELKVLQQQQSLEQSIIKTTIEKNRLTREQLKAEQDLTKAIEAEEKQKAKQLKSLKDLNSEYKQGVKRLAEIKVQLKELKFTGQENTKVYQSLSKEFGELDKRVRSAEESVGEFQRSVGNYKEALKDVVGETGLFNTGIGRLIGTLKKLKEQQDDAAEGSGKFGKAVKLTLIGIALAAAASAKELYDMNQAAQDAVNIKIAQGKDLLLSGKPFENLERLTISFRKELLKLNLEFQKLSLDEQDYNEISQDSTLSFQKRNEALAIAIELSEKRAAVAVKIAQSEKDIADAAVAAQEANPLIPVGGANPEFYQKQNEAALKLNAALDEQGDLIRINEQRTREANLNATIAEIELTRSKKLNAKGEEQILKQQLEDQQRQLEERIDINKKLLASQKATSQEEIRIFKEGIGIQFDETKLFNEENAIALKKRLEALGLGEAATAELAKIVKIYQDNVIASNETIAKQEEEKIKRTQKIAEIDRQILQNQLDYEAEIAQQTTENVNQRREQNNAKLLEGDNAFNLKRLKMREYYLSLQNDLIQGEYDTAKRALEARAEDERIKAAESIADEKIRAEEIKKINEKLAIDLDKLANKKYDAEKAATQKTKEETEALRKKQTEVVIDEIDKVTNAIAKAVQRRNELANEELDTKISDTEKAIEQQQRLAERGLANTLAFEQSKAAKLQLERKRLQEQEIKQQKRVAFYNLLSGYAKTEPATALQKAILETTLAEIVAGSFIDGTENVERDLSGNKVHNGKDGYVIAVDGDERIFNPQQNAKIGDISNDEAAQILSDYQSGKLFNYGDVTQPIINVPNQHIDLRSTNNLLLEVKRAIENKPVNHTNLSNLGDVIETQITAGVKRVLIHKRQRRI